MHYAIQFLCDNYRKKIVMDPTEKTTIEQRLIESGEKERLKEHLRNRLIESGWRQFGERNFHFFLDQKGLQTLG